MNAEREREAFETWLQGTHAWRACKQRGKPMSLRTHMDGSYADYRVNDRWGAWKARASLTRPTAWRTAPGEFGPEQRLFYLDTGEPVPTINLEDDNE